MLKMDPLERQKTLRSLIRDEHLTCSICFGSFTAPKALPCLHTFCEGCLRDYVTGRNYDSEGSFPCPMCRKDIPLPPQGVAGFPDNHLMASLSDTIETNSNHPSVPPRPSQTAIDTAIQHHSHVSPLPNLFQRTKVSPTPQTLPVPLQHGGAYPSSGARGDEGKAGLVTPTSPYEYVDKSGEVSGQTYPNLYPQLSNPDEEEGPCMKKVLLHFGYFGANIVDFRKPYGLAVGRNGEFVVSDHAGNRLFVFSNSGEKTVALIIKDCFVNGVAITKDNNILITASKSGSAIMKMYSMQGKLIKSIGEYYRFDTASGITVTPSNFVAVTNLAADNVLVFTEQLKFSVKFGWKGSGDKHFLQPQFITSTLKDYLVVSDTGNHTIKIFDLAGNFKRSFGGKGDSHGHLDTPLGIATDSEDNIVIADSNNFRVEIFNVKGQFLTTLVQNTNLIGPDVKPINVAVTPRNNVAVLFYGTGFAEVRVYSWRQASIGRRGVSSV